MLTNKKIQSNGRSKVIARNIRKMVISIKIEVQRKCCGNTGEREINSNFEILEDFVKGLELEDGSLIMRKISMSSEIKKKRGSSRQTEKEKPR